MKHRMNLFNEPFDSIKNNRKSVEIRLYDMKRRLIEIGDTIEFHKPPGRDEVIEVRVVDLMKFDTFEEMYSNVPFEDFDCSNRTIEEMIERTFRIYTREQEKQWGTLAIGIKLI